MPYSDSWSHLATVGSGSGYHRRHRSTGGEVVLARRSRSSSLGRINRELAVLNIEPARVDESRRYRTVRDSLGTSHLDEYTRDEIWRTRHRRSSVHYMSGAHPRVHATEDAALAILRTQNDQMNRQLAFNSSPRSDSSWQSYNSYGSLERYTPVPLPPAPVYHYDYGYSNYRRPVNTHLRTTLHRMPNWIWSDIAQQWYREECGRVVWLDKYWVRS